MLQLEPVIDLRYLSTEMLLAELRRRRMPVVEDAPLILPGLTLEPAGQVATWEDRAVEMSTREFAMLAVIARAHPRPLSIDAILSIVWRHETYDRQNVAITAVYIRRKLPGLLASRNVRDGISRHGIDAVANRVRVHNPCYWLLVAPPGDA